MPCPCPHSSSLSCSSTLFTHTLIHLPTARLRLTPFPSVLISRKTIARKLDWGKKKLSIDLRRMTIDSYLIVCSLLVQFYASVKVSRVCLCFLDMGSNGNGANRRADLPWCLPCFFYGNSRCACGVFPPLIMPQVGVHPLISSCVPTASGALGQAYISGTASPPACCLSPKL